MRPDRVRVIQKLVQRGWSQLAAERVGEQVVALDHSAGGARQPWTVEKVKDLHRVARDSGEVSVYDDDNKARVEDVRDVLNETEFEG